MTQRSGSEGKPAADGLDEDAWQCLTLAVVAANRGDGDGMSIYLRKFEALPEDKFDAASSIGSTCCGLGSCNFCGADRPRRTFMSLLAGLIRGTGRSSEDL